MLTITAPTAYVKSCCNGANLQLTFELCEILQLIEKWLLLDGQHNTVFLPFFGQLIFRKILKIIATRGQILKLKCTKFDFGWGSAPDPAGGAYSAPPDPLAGFKGAYF